MWRRFRRGSARTRASMEYDDDSSTALGLTHRARVRRAKDAAIAEVAEADLSPATRGVRVLERRIAALVADGMDAVRATDQALAESHSAIDDEVEGSDPERDLTPREREQAAERAYLGASIQALMAVGRVGHSGSRSGRRAKSARTGTWVCRECHTEWCGHRPRARVCRTCLQPRPCDCYSGRSEVVAGRVSRRARETLAESEISIGEMLEALATAALLSGGGAQALGAICARLVADAASA